MAADRRSGRSDRRANGYCSGSCSCQGGSRVETCRRTHGGADCLRCNPANWPRRHVYGFALAASMGPLEGVPA